MQELLDLRLLATFAHAARSGSISMAARLAGRTQPTVTMQIQRLEEVLGTRLFHRSGRGVRLTGSGERFLVYAEKILGLHDEAILTLSKKGLYGSMIFGCPEDFLIAFFPKILTSFGSIYPDVDIRVVSAPTTELRGLLHARQVDLAIMSTLDTHDVAKVIRSEPLVWVGNKPALELYSFADNIPTAMPEPNSVDYRAACAEMSKAGLRHKISYASNSLAGLIAVARSGLAISVMTQAAVPPDLFILNEPLPQLPKLGIVLSFAENDRAPAINVFADHVRAVLPSL